ncbi:MAG: hypothetical protein ACRCTQ_06185 [Brevinemataceae bacterium]
MHKIIIISDNYCDDLSDFLIIGKLVVQTNFIRNKLSHTLNINTSFFNLLHNLYMVMLDSLSRNKICYSSFPDELLLDVSDKDEFFFHLENVFSKILKRKIKILFFKNDLEYSSGFYMWCGNEVQLCFWNETEDIDVHLFTFLK